MKRFLLPLILVILVLSVVFVSCGKETPAPEKEETEKEQVSTTTKKETEEDSDFEADYDTPVNNGGAPATTTKRVLHAVRFPAYTTVSKATTSTTTVTKKVQAVSPAKGSSKTELENKNMNLTFKENEALTPSGSLFDPVRPGNVPSVSVSAPSVPLDPNCKHVYTYATCTTARTCKLCGGTKGNALGHDMENPTCEKDSTCKRCGHYAPALGHDIGSATCTQGATCKNGCGLTVPALGHDIDNPTCTQSTTCKRGCGYTKAALGHRYTGGICVNCNTPIGSVTPGEGESPYIPIPTP